MVGEGEWNPCLTGMMMMEGHDGGGGCKVLDSRSLGGRAPEEVVALHVAEPAGVDDDSTRTANWRGQAFWLGLFDPEPRTKILL